MKKTIKSALKILTPILIAIFILCFLVFCLPIILLTLYSEIAVPSPVEPQIEYAEFPFEIVYVHGGEEVVIKGVYVCEYDGIGGDGINVSKFRKWKGYVKDTGDQDPILFEDEERIIYCSVGYAEYYMSDPDFDNQEDYTPHLYSKAKTIASIGSLANEEITNKYNIEIKSWELSKPIENEYSVREQSSNFFYIIFSIAVLVIIVFIVVFLCIRKKRCYKKSVRQ